MADLKISQLPSAETLANTDLIPVKTTAGTKAITFENLKKSQEGYFQKEGTPIWDSETGATSINTLTLQIGNAYEFWVGYSLLNLKKLVIAFPTYIDTFHTYTIFGNGTTCYVGKICFFNGGPTEIETSTLSLEYSSGETPEVANIFYIFKITDLGEISFDEE